MQINGTFQFDLAANSVDAHFSAQTAQWGGCSAVRLTCGVAEMYLGKRRKPLIGHVRPLQLSGIPSGQSRRRPSSRTTDWLRVMAYMYTARLRSFESQGHKLSYLAAEDCYQEPKSDLRRGRGAYLYGHWRYLHPSIFVRYWSLRYFWTVSTMIWWSWCCANPLTTITPTMPSTPLTRTGNPPP